MLNNLKHSQDWKNKKQLVDFQRNKQVERFDLRR